MLECWTEFISQAIDTKCDACCRRPRTTTTKHRIVAVWRQKKLRLGKCREMTLASQPQLVSFLIYNDYLIAAWRARCRSRTQSTRTLFPLSVPGISGFLPVYRGNMYSSRLRAFAGTKSFSLLRKLRHSPCRRWNTALKLQIIGDDDKFPHWNVTQLHQNGVEDCKIFVSSRSLNAKVWKFYGLSLPSGDGGVRGLRNCLQVVKPDFGDISMQILVWGV